MRTTHVNPVTFSFLRHNSIFLKIFRQKLLMAVYFILAASSAFSQSLAVNTDGSAANTSSILDIKSSDKGILIPRMSKAQRNAITTPATGLMVFQNTPDSIGFYYYNGAAWLWLATAASDKGWATTGNAGTDTAVNFIGTTDNMPIRFKQNNGWVGQYDRSKQNYFTGSGSGQKITTGTGNTSLGDSSMAFMTTGVYNTAVGNNALKKADNTFGNTAIGGDAMLKTTTGYSNTGVGYGALYSNSTGTQNVATGAGAMVSHRLGNENVAVGTDAMFSDTSGNANIAIGSDAMFNSRNTMGNIAIGYSALYNNVKKNNKIAIGFNALSSDTASGPNIAIGNYSMISNTAGFGNTAIGNATLRSNVSGGNNTAIGDSALYLNTASNNTALGFGAARNNTTGADILAIGDSALYSNNTGAQNIAIGSRSLRNNTSGKTNIAIGKDALASNVLSNNNIAIGEDALTNMNSSGFALNTGNVAIGYETLKNVNPVAVTFSGNQNTSVGTRSGLSLSTGYYNTIFGYEAGSLVTTGSQNTIIGHFANATGNQNTVIGARANVSSSLSNSTAVGYSALASGNNCIVLGSINGINGATATAKTGIGTSIPETRLHVVKDSTLISGVVNSSTIALFENDSTGYIQLLNPSTSESGVISGNGSTSIRAGVIFRPDSSIFLRTGGNSTRLTVANDGLVGIRTTLPTSYLDVSGSVGYAIQTTVTSQTLDEFDHTLIITPAAGIITITLPAASTCARREYVIVNQDNVGKTITGYQDFTGTTVTTAPANTSITIQSNGVNWYRIR